MENKEKNLKILHMDADGIVMWKDNNNKIPRPWNI